MAINVAFLPLGMHIARYVNTTQLRCPGLHENSHRSSGHGRMRQLQPAFTRMVVGACDIGPCHSLLRNNLHAALANRRVHPMVLYCDDELAYA